ncbi:MAG: arginine--tRNA ligase [Rhodothermia bacterium]|nr:arginine--tRNA ligase [Rhodothermia bacterium]
MEQYLLTQLNNVLVDWTGVPDDFVAELEKPNNPDHGDLATSAALKLARHLRRSPRDIADELRERLLARPLDPSIVSSVEVAGAGFINFRFADRYLHRQLEQLLEAGSDFGRAEQHGKTAIVEFVSANPTGPLTVGHGRNAVLGDTIANLLEWTGFAVTREYYFNDAGRQMRVLGQSVKARYDELVNPQLPMKTIEGPEGEPVEVPDSFPDDGYLGEYIVDIASEIRRSQDGSVPENGDAESFSEFAEKNIFESISATLRRLGVRMDTFFNERSLYDSGDVWTVVERLRALGYIYDKDGAVWFKMSELGGEQDKVLVKSTGEPTYRLPDIAYHADKLNRGFDLVVDIFGADHIATYPDVLAALDVLGFDTSKIKVVIYQFVTLLRAGQPVKMSTRKANFESLDDLLDEVGDDVTRYFFLVRSPNSHLEFDLDAATEASENNPVFYPQYAHARICSIEKKAEEVGVDFDSNQDLSILAHEAEIALIKSLLLLPSVIKEAADAYEPHKLAGYLRDVAVAFTQFYGSCRIIGEDRDISSARMQLAIATRTVLANGLSVLGISAPERM